MTNKEIGNNAIEFAIERYLRAGETRTDMIKQFDGDSVRLVQFLREREFNAIESLPCVTTPSWANEEKLLKTEVKVVIEPVIEQAEEKQVEQVAEPLPEPMKKSEVKTEERIEEIKKKHDQQQADSQLTMF